MKFFSVIFVSVLAVSCSKSDSGSNLNQDVVKKADPVTAIVKGQTLTFKSDFEVKLDNYRSADLYNKDKDRICAQVHVEGVSIGDTISFKSGSSFKVSGFEINIGIANIKLLREDGKGTIYLKHQALGISNSNVVDKLSPADRALLVRDLLKTLKIAEITDADK